MQGPQQQWVAVKSSWTLQVINIFIGWFASVYSRISCTYLFTHSLTHSLHGAGYYLKSWLSLSLSKNILLSYGTWRFITVFTQARHWTLSWASWFQFAPSIPISLRSILMLSSHLLVGLPSGLLPSASQPKPCKHLSPPPCVPHAPLTSSSLI
jgi:hypothetical protein